MTRGAATGAVGPLGALLTVADLAMAAAAPTARARPGPTAAVGIAKVIVAAPIVLAETNTDQKRLDLLMSPPLLE
jgi:hypothetical protein